jgi:uncharacterized protein YndB with AHSA1/START domain
MTVIAPVEVTLHVQAPPDEVFTYLTDPDRYVQWMGSQATFQLVPGGAYRIAMADGFAAAGTFRIIDRPRQLAFTWGFADDEAARHTRHEPGRAATDSVMPPGSTRVTVTLQDADGGTQLTLRHENLPSAELRGAHQIAWDTYLPRLAVRAAGGAPGPDPHA